MIKKEDEKSDLIRQLALLGVVPVILVVGPLVGLFLGKLLDRWLGTEPLLMTLCLVFGFVAAGREIYRIIKKVNRDS